LWLLHIVAIRILLVYLTNGPFIKPLFSEQSSDSIHLKLKHTGKTATV